MHRTLTLDESNYLRNSIFRGMLISMCTWSTIRCPSTIRLSFCFPNW